MLVDEVKVLCTEDLWYEDVLIGKKGTEYEVISYASSTVILRGERDMDAIINGSYFRRHFLLQPKGERK